jgi:hypothetical protein
MRKRNVPTTIKLNSNPFLTALRWTWSGKETKPTFELISRILGAACGWCSLLIEFASDSWRGRTNFEIVELVVDVP